jgi:predicted amidohydrolase
MIVAAAQFEPAERDVRANLAVARQLAFEAAAKGARLVVLPELCLSGRVLMSARDAADCAQSAAGYQTESLREIAARFCCVIAMGYVEAQRGRLFNATALIGPTGLLGNARKRNLAGTDHMWAARGEDMLPCVPTELGRVGVLIDRDGMNAMRESSPLHRVGVPLYRRGSVDVVCHPTSMRVDDDEAPDASWVDLAESLSAAVVVACSAGNSCVIDRRLFVWSHGSARSGPAVVGGLVSL